MINTFYAVFGTNVLVSALLTKRVDSPIVVTPAEMMQIVQGIK